MWSAWQYFNGMHTEHTVCNTIDRWKNRYIFEWVGVSAEYYTLNTYTCICICFLCQPPYAIHTFSLVFSVFFFTILYSDFSGEIPSHIEFSSIFRPNDHHLLFAIINVIHWKVLFNTFLIVNVNQIVYLNGLKFSAYFDKWWNEKNVFISKSFIHSFIRSFVRLEMRY